MYIICEFSFDLLYNCCYYIIFFQKNIFIEMERKKMRDKREIDRYIEGWMDGQIDREGRVEREIQREIVLKRQVILQFMIYELYI